MTLPPMPVISFVAGCTASMLLILMCGVTPPTWVVSLPALFWVAWFAASLAYSLVTAIVGREEETS